MRNISYKILPVLLERLQHFYFFLRMLGPFYYLLIYLIKRSRFDIEISLFDAF